MRSSRSVRRPAVLESNLSRFAKLIRKLVARLCPRGGLQDRDGQGKACVGDERGVASTSAAPSQ
jgi:hypothetical protein